MFYKRLLVSENTIIKAMFAGNMCQSTLISKCHLAIRKKYDLIALDLSSACRASIVNVFYSCLKRKVNDRNRSDIQAVKGR